MVPTHRNSQPLSAIKRHNVGDGAGGDDYDKKTGKQHQASPPSLHKDLDTVEESQAKSSDVPKPATTQEDTF